MSESEVTDGSWLVLSYPTNPAIRIDSCIFDLVESSGSELILQSNATRFSLPMSSDEAARLIAQQMTPFTRSVPITQVAAYEYARNRRSALQRGVIDDSVSLLLGDVSVTLSLLDNTRTLDTLHGYIHFREVVFSLIDVSKYADAGAHLDLSFGSIQAALPVLLAADRLRDDDLEFNNYRIANYESKTAT